MRRSSFNLRYHWVNSSTNTWIYRSFGEGVIVARIDIIYDVYHRIDRFILILYESEPIIFHGTLDEAKEEIEAIINVRNKFKESLNGNS